MVTQQRAHESGAGLHSSREHPVDAWPADSWEGPVLAVRISSLGDVIVALDAVARLKDRRPDLRIDFLTRPQYAGLAGLCPQIERVLVDGERSPEGAPYEVLWDLQGGPKSKKSTRGLRWKRRVSARAYGLRRRGMALLGRRIPSPPHQLHRFLRPAAGPAAAGAGRRARGESILRSSAPESGGHSPLVGLAPHAKHPLKEWPLQCFSEVARCLEDQGVPSLWFLDPGRSGQDPEPGRSIRAPLDEVARAMAACDLVISGDTGLGHLASALGIPVLVLFGSTVPELGYTPTGPHTVLEVDLPCRPCHVHGAKRCWLGHKRCILDLTPEVVAGRALALLMTTRDQERKEG